MWPPYMESDFTTPSVSSPDSSPIRSRSKAFSSAPLAYMDEWETVDWCRQLSELQSQHAKYAREITELSRHNREKDVMLAEFRRSDAYLVDTCLRQQKELLAFRASSMEEHAEGLRLLRESRETRIQEQMLSEANTWHQAKQGQLRPTQEESHQQMSQPQESPMSNAEAAQEHAASDSNQATEPAQGVLPIPAVDFSKVFRPVSVETNTYMRELHLNVEIEELERTLHLAEAQRFQLNIDRQLVTEKQDLDWQIAELNKRRKILEQNIEEHHSRVASHMLEAKGSGERANALRKQLEWMVPGKPASSPEPPVFNQELHGMFALRDASTGAGKAPTILANPDAALQETNVPPQIDVKNLFDFFAAPNRATLDEATVETVPSSLTLLAQDTRTVPSSPLYTRHDDEAGSLCKDMERAFSTVPGRCRHGTRIALRKDVFFHATYPLDSTAGGSQSLLLAQVSTPKFSVDDLFTANEKAKYPR
eukprot:GEMP01020132.1.p1 GENE.GEMP01020132.1~~GEMP01020132.1.p1  ORF type:complete len:479 (+),score=113.06 GEMP01020132.1:260-1696(+)